MKIFWPFLCDSIDIYRVFYHFNVGYVSMAISASISAPQSSPRYTSVFMALKTVFLVGRFPAKSHVAMSPGMRHTKAGFAQ